MNKLTKTGFTVVESLIFLAVAGGLVATTITMLYNRQKSVEFRQSVKQFEADLNDIINDTATGRFPVVNQVKCSYDQLTQEILFEPDSEAAPGRNKSCIFLGKVIQFGDDKSPPEPDDTYGIHTLLGSVLATQGSYRSSPYITTLSNNMLGPHFDTYDERHLDWFGAIADAYYIDDRGRVHYIQGIAILYSEFGELYQGNAYFGDFQSGSSRVSIFAIRTGEDDQTPRAGSVRLGSSAFRDYYLDGSLGDTAYITRLEDMVVRPPSKIVICMISQRTGQKALIEIGTGEGVPRARLDFNVIPSKCVYN